MQRRAELARSRQHSRDRGDDYRADTRRKIELGGPVLKSGLADVLDDNRAAILGALMSTTEQAHNSTSAARFLDRGLREFDRERRMNAEEDGDSQVLES